MLGRGVEGGETMVDGEGWEGGKSERGKREGAKVRENNSYSRLAFKADIVVDIGDGSECLRCATPRGL